LNVAGPYLHNHLHAGNAKTFVASALGGLGEKCNPAKTCAEIVAAKLPSGTYNFVVTEFDGNGTAAVSRLGYCNVGSEKMSYDGTAKENFALSCKDVFVGFPYSPDGSYWTGADAKCDSVSSFVSFFFVCDAIFY
jgi:hypothetical protein